MTLKTTVTYTLSRCVKCLRCIQSCPTSALSMQNNRIRIDQNLCLNCGQCIRTCQSKGLSAQGSTLADITNYDVTVCLVPSAFTTRCSSGFEARQMFYALKKIGFDEVVDLSPYEGRIHDEFVTAASTELGTSITSFCPVINRLIQLQYPILAEAQAALRYPSEAAARDLRQRMKGQGTVGIFLLCECEAKLALAKYPYGNSEYEVDHAMSSVDLMPVLRKHLSEGVDELTLCPQGLLTANPSQLEDDTDFLVVDGLERCSSVLSMLEFNQLPMYRGMELYACANGCIGGHLLWGNSYAARKNTSVLINDLRHKETAVLSPSALHVSEKAFFTSDTRTFQEKLAAFQKIQQILEQLPGFDCSACGVQTCRKMAEMIVEGKRTLNDCRVLAAENNPKEDSA